MMVEVHNYLRCVCFRRSTGDDLDHSLRLVIADSDVKLKNGLGKIHFIVWKAGLMYCIEFLP